MSGRHRFGAWLFLGAVGIVAPLACGGSASHLRDEVGAGGEGSGAADQGSDAGGSDSASGGAPVVEPSVGGEAFAAGTGGGPASCDPGERECDGASVRVCKPDGSGTSVETTCTLSQVCTTGTCQDIVCTPDVTLCKDDGVWKCSSNGLSLTLVKPCASDEFCLQEGDETSCSLTLCTPGKPFCDDQVATQCRADGSGAKPGGKDCAASNLVCHDGQCEAQACVPGQKLCQHDDVYLCSASGTEATLFAACDTDEVCDEELATCRKRLCDPGKLTCDGSRVTKCAASGVAWEQTGKDCADTDQLCSEGSCKTRICLPNTTYCDKNGVYVCDSTGLTSTLQQQCGASQYCAFWYSNYYACQNYACTPGTPTCNINNVLSTCKADGTGPEAGGTSCGGDKTCSNGSCLEHVCTPGKAFCNGNVASYCSYDGLSSYSYTSCGDSARCTEGADGVTCDPFLCDPGQKTCIGNQIGVCDDGFALSSVSTDCNTTNQVCTAAAGCADSTVDTIGDAEELQSEPQGMVIGDIIEVTSNRQLSQIEADLVLAGARDLRWVVYRLIDSNFVALFDKVVQGQTGSGYFSSGTINVNLVVGKTYLIGVAVNGGGFVPYYDAAPWAVPVSFGQVQGSLATPYSTSVYRYSGTNSLAYDLRLTSGAP